MASTSRQRKVKHAFAEVAPTASTSGRSTLPEKKLPYDVFINHRGPDVKHTLAASLHKTLTGMGLRVFLDSEELKLGESLPKEIEEAMHSASLHIAIFSQNYAQSPWCLSELSFMLKTGAQIVPVFYHVQPDDVRYAKGVYAEAFSHHKKKRRYRSRKLKEWKNALNSVSFNVGHIVNNEDDERRLPKNIVNCVLKVIKNVPFVVAKHPIGLDEAVIAFESIRLQSAESHPVQVVGIWGMGGSGKTTLAKQLFNNKYTSMEKSSFLLDVRDAASKSLLHQKQKKLIEDLGLPGVSVDNIEEGKGILASRLRFIRVLIVLDDVDHVDQLDALVPKKDSLGQGSLIVVTTRERDVLRGWGITSIYKMKALNAPHAEQLFCWHAFLQPSPPLEFEDLVKNFLNVCKGLPLSLKVFGAQLYDNSNKESWESVLHKISRILDKEITKQLKVSYDALENEERQMFLDCACFFIGEKKTSVIAAWDGSEWSGLYGLEKLLNKCLVELDDEDRIRMHDHLRDLGREIADQRSPYRLRSPQQIINVDNEEQRIGIRGIRAESTGEVEFLRCSRGGELIINTSRGDCSLTPNALGLKIFECRGNYYNQVIGDKSRELVWLRWFNPGQRNLRSLSSLKNLRVLELHGGREWQFDTNLTELWETDSDGPVQLRELVLSSFSNLQEFPKSIGCLRHLKKIVLLYGSNLRSLPESFCLLQSLEHLQLSCVYLSSLPEKFGDLRNLKHLDLYACIELRVLPDSFKKLALLQHLSLEVCYNLTLESDFLENMTKLEYLNFEGCKLDEFPRHITNQASLRVFVTGQPSLRPFGLCGDPISFREIPMNISQLSKLQKFFVGSKSLTSLPTTLGDLSSLTDLVIGDCSQLEFLPDSVGRLNLLETLEITSSGLKSLPKSFRQLNNLLTLKINTCPLSSLGLEAGSLSSSLCNLKRIFLYETQVSKISISEDCCPGLEILRLDYNDRLTEIEVLPTTIKFLYLERCVMVRNISSIVGLVNIRTLSIKHCPKLDALPSFAQLASLQEFELGGCDGVKKIQGLEHCRALETVRAETRWEEAGIETLECMQKLRSLHLTAISRPAVEVCIPKWTEEIIVCARAVPESSSLIDSFAFSNPSVIDSFSHLKIHSCPSLKLPSNAHCILLCFVINCIHGRDGDDDKANLVCICGYDDDKANLVCICGYDDDSAENRWLRLGNGRWLLICVYTQRSRYCKSNKFVIKDRFSKKDYEVERGIAVVGEEEKVEEAFQSLWKLPSH